MNLTKPITNNHKNFLKGDTMTRPPLDRLEVLTLISLALNSLLLIVVIFIAVTLMMGGVKTKPSVLPISHITTLDLIAVKTNIIIPKMPKSTISRSSKLDPHEEINNYVNVISATYDIDPNLIKSVIQSESEYIPTAKVGACLGLMQVSTYWHSKRAEKLGVTNFYDPHDNILIGVDYLAELFDSYKDPALVLMLYSMDHKTAFKLYSEGKITDYAKTVLARAEVYRKGG